MARPPSDSPPDSSAPQDPAADDDEVSPSKARPPFPPHIDTMIGSHLPALLEEEAIKQADQASRVAPPQIVPQPKPIEDASSVDEAASADPEEKWRSPLERRPAWLIALASVPLRLWAMAGGGLVAGLLLVSAARGCVGKSRIDDLEQRVARLEKTVGVNADAGANASSDPASNANAPASSATAATATSDDPKKQNCAVAKLAAYQAWQGAADKAKSLAAPAQAKCASFWTDAKKQACYGATLQSARSAEVARDASIKGGEAARDAVKKVKDDPKNDAIVRARVASSTAFDTCQDANEL